MDLTNLVDVAKLSGGNSYRFLDFNRNDSRHSKRFKETLRRYLSREIGWNTSFEQKVHPGFKIVKFFGNHSQDPDEKCQRTDLPVVHPNTNFGFELSLDENVPVHVERVCFQVVLHYTTPIGQNRTRIHTVAVPVTDSLLAVAKSVDQQCLAAYLTKLTAEELLTKKQSQDVICQHLKHKCDSISASYRSALALLSLMAPYNNRYDDDSGGAMKDFKSLLLYVTSVLQSGTQQLKNRSTDDCVSILEQWRVLPVSQLISFLFSRLYEVSNRKTIHLLDARWEELKSSNAYLLDMENVIYFIIGRNVSYSFLTDVFGVLDYDEVPDELNELPMLLTQRSNTLRCFVAQLQSQKCHRALFQIVKEESSITDLLENLLLNFTQ
ncbi:protein transport protein Sec24A-like [Daphnia magna]|uniref:protein transport protein Sec24A-like n=1 Tax=Daphnia magna TaxID=35525 RepID=UPI001E1BB784|nr:protein transport protein Sec24A-like [Daphnia magna]